MRIERITLGGFNANPVGPGDGCFDQRFVLGGLWDRSGSGGGRVYRRKCGEWSYICRLTCVDVEVVWLTAWS